MNDTATILAALALLVALLCLGGVCILIAKCSTWNTPARNRADSGPMYALATQAMEASRQSLQSQAAFLEVARDAIVKALDVASVPKEDQLKRVQAEQEKTVVVQRTGPAGAQPIPDGEYLDPSMFATTQPL